MAHLVITIGCEYGAKGNMIGKKVAKDLGIKFYDRDTVDEIIKEVGIQKEIMEKEDMKVLMHFYKCVMIGVILDWMDHRMSYDLTEYAEKLRELYENTFEKTLEKVAGTKPAYLKIL